MKIKYNIPMLNNIKNGIKNIRTKITNNKERNLKVNFKYYTLLILMLMIGTISFSSNIKRYNDINSENFTKYDMNEKINVDTDDVDISYYDTAISSISTNVANIIDDQESSNENSSETQIKYIYPVQGEIIKEYAMDTLVYSKTLDMWRVHQGIDIKASLGSEVVSIGDGKIISIDNDSFYGETIKIEHTNGYISIYSNLDKIENKKVGENIQQGETIGNVGVSAYGEVSDESHLHFELLKNNEWINPLNVLE